MSWRLAVFPHDQSLTDCASVVGVPRHKITRAGVARGDPQVHHALKRRPPRRLRPILVVRVRPRLPPRTGSIDFTLKPTSRKTGPLVGRSTSKVRSRSIRRCRGKHESRSTRWCRMLARHSPGKRHGRVAVVGGGRTLLAWDVDAVPITRGLGATAPQDNPPLRRAATVGAGVAPQQSLPGQQPGSVDAMSGPMGRPTGELRQ